MPLAAQIIDQQVSGILDRQSEVFTLELQLGEDEPRRRSIAFLFLVARTAFDLTDEQTIEGIVDAGCSTTNIRRYLGLAGNRVNEAVAATLRELIQRSNFYFYRQRHHDHLFAISATTRSRRRTGACR